MGMSITKIWLVEVLGITGVLPADLTLRYFCAYSAHCPCGDYTWGAAPGFILLRLQRALIEKTALTHPK